MSYDVLEIGLFQLENLASTPTQFLFFDLRKKTVPTAEPLDRILIRAERIDPRDLPDVLRAKKADVGAPVVLVCENGRKSLKAGLKLARAGFTNVCVASGGARGLLGEL